jgi:hypothetical protein
MLCFVLDLQVSRIIDGDMDDSSDHEMEMVASSHLPNQMYV